MSWPSEIFTFRDIENRPDLEYDEDKKQVLFAEDIQNIVNEIISVETWLGSAWDDYVPYIGADRNLDLGAFSYNTIVGYLFGGQNAIKLATKSDTTDYTSTIIGREAGDNGTTTATYRQTAIGYKAGFQNSSQNQTAIGYLAGLQNSGIYQVALGTLAGQQNSKAWQIAIGYYSGYKNEGINQIALGGYSGLENTADNVFSAGYEAGLENTGRDSFFVGYRAGKKNTGDNVIAIGREAGENNILDNQLIIKQNHINATPLLLGDFLSGNLSIPGVFFAGGLSLDLGDDASFSLDTKDIVGGGMAITPRIKMTNDNIVGLPTNVGLIDEGFVVQSDNNTPLIALCGEDIVTKDIALITYDPDIKFLQIRNSGGNDELTEADKVIQLTQNGTFFWGGGKFFAQEGATGTKESVQIFGKFLGSSSAGSKTSLLFMDRIPKGLVGMSVKTGAVVGVLNNNVEETWGGGLELCVFNYNSPDTPIIFMETGADGKTKFNFDVDIDADLSVDNLSLIGDLELASDSGFYIGAKETNGSWRIMRYGDNLVFERREAGDWVVKETISA